MGFLYSAFEHAITAAGTTDLRRYEVIYVGHPTLVPTVVTKCGGYLVGCSSRNVEGYL